jgi:hypothetical protein
MDSAAVVVGLARVRALRRWIHLRISRIPTLARLKAALQAEAQVAVAEERARRAEEANAAAAMLADLRAHSEAMAEVLAHLRTHENRAAVLVNMLRDRGAESAAAGAHLNKVAGELGELVRRTADMCLVLISIDDLARVLADTTSTRRAPSEVEPQTTGTEPAPAVSRAAPGEPEADPGNRGPRLRVGIRPSGFPSERWVEVYDKENQGPILVLDPRDVDERESTMAVLVHDAQTRAGEVLVECPPERPLRGHKRWVPRALMLGLDVTPTPVFAGRPRIKVAIQKGEFIMERSVSFNVGERTYALVVNAQRVDEAEGTMLVTVVSDDGRSVVVDLPGEAIHEGRRVHLPRDLVLDLPSPEGGT